MHEAKSNLNWRDRSSFQSVADSPLGGPSYEVTFCSIARELIPLETDPRDYSRAWYAMRGVVVLNDEGVSYAEARELCEADHRELTGGDAIPPSFAALTIEPGPEPSRAFCTDEPITPPGLPVLTFTMNDLRRGRELAAQIRELNARELARYRAEEEEDGARLADNDHDGLS